MIVDVRGRKHNKDCGILGSRFKEVFETVLCNINLSEGKRSGKGLRGRRGREPAGETSYGLQSPLLSYLGKLFGENM